MRRPDPHPLDLSARPVAAGGILCLFVVLEALRGFYHMFLKFSPWDDEGYLMMTVKQFLDGHPLYAQIYSQYGPFYYLYEWATYRATRVALSHDAVRTLTLVLWLATALLCAWAVYRVTRSIVLAAILQFMVFHVLLIFSQEPGQAVDICTVLQAGGILLACYVEGGKRRGWVLAGLGAVFAALTLTKVNEGGLFGIPIGIALLAYARNNRVLRVLWLAAAALGLALPFALMHVLLAQSWARNFAIVVAASFATVLLAAHGRTREAFGWSDYAVLVFSSIGTGFLICLFFIARGTSLHVLLDGVLLAPWHSVGAFVELLRIPNEGVSWGAVGLLIAGIYFSKSMRLLPQADWAVRIVPFLKGAFATGVFLCQLVVPERFPLLLAYGTPFLFLSLLPGTQESPSRLPFYRLAWCLIAVFQTLQSYPVAGTEAILSQYPMMVVAVICLGDLLEFLTLVSRRVAMTGRLRRVAEAFVLLVLAALYIRGVRRERRDYLANTPLDLPGAAWMRLPQPVAAAYQQLTAQARENADVLVTLPGMYSFYFWAQEDPPTCRNVGDWLGLITDDEQQEAVEVIKRHRRAAVIYSPQLVQFWRGRSQLPQTQVLVGYIFMHFHTVSWISPNPHFGIHESYQFMVRNEDISH